MFTRDEFFKIFTENLKDLDLDNLNAYIDFVIKNNGKFKNYKEAHHLLPRALFPKFVSVKANLFKLSAGNHLEAHFLLYKLLPNDPAVVCSLNMMVNRGRMDPHFDISSVERLLEKYKVEYEEYRVKVAKIISECNTGRKRSDEHRQIISESNSGKVCVRDKNGFTFRTSIDDPRLLSGELVNARIGYKTSIKTKEKMKKSREKYKGMKFYNNGKEVKLMYGPTEEFCYEGCLKETIQKKKQNANHEFIHKDGVQRRLKAGEEVPEGWTRGRLKKGGFDGSAHINNRWFDLKTKEIIDRDPGVKTRYMRYSKDFKTKEYPVYDGWLFTNVEDLIKYLDKNNKHLIYKLNSIPLLQKTYERKYDELSTELLEKVNNFFNNVGVKHLNEYIKLDFVKVYDVDFNKVNFYEFSTPKKGRFSK